MTDGPFIDSQEIVAGEAAAAYRLALELAENPAEREFLVERIRLPRVTTGRRLAAWHTTSSR